MAQGCEAVSSRTDLDEKIRKSRHSDLFFLIFDLIFIACVTYYVRAVTLLYIEARNDIKVSYNKLWKLLIDRKMKRVQLRDTVGISSFTLARLGRDECVSMRILLKICEELNCNIGDIVEVLPDEVICQSQNIQRMQNGKHE